jgi:hypothetical protein
MIPPITASLLNSQRSHQKCTKCWHEAWRGGKRPESWRPLWGRLVRRSGFYAPVSERHDIRQWHKADVRMRNFDVRFLPDCVAKVRKAEGQACIVE